MLTQLCIAVFLCELINTQVIAITIFVYNLQLLHDAIDSQAVYINDNWHLVV